MPNNKTIREEGWEKEVNFNPLLDMTKVKDILAKEREETDKKIDYNSHDLGEMGQFIRTEYLTNILNIHDHRILSALRAEIGRMKKEIFNEDEVGKVGTHAIASNQNAGYNQALTDLLSALKEKKDNLK